MLCDQWQTSKTRGILRESPPEALTSRGSWATLLWRWRRTIGNKKQFPEWWLQFSHTNPSTRLWMHTHKHTNVEIHNVSICLLKYMYIHVHVWTYGSIQMYAYIHSYIYTYIYTQTAVTYSYVHMYWYISTHYTHLSCINIHMCIIYIQAYTCMFTCVCSHAFVYNTHIHSYIYSYASTHVFTCTQINSSNC